MAIKINFEDENGKVYHTPVIEDGPKHNSPGLKPWQKPYIPEKDRTPDYDKWIRTQKKSKKRNV